MSHVTYEWVVSQVNEPYHKWMSHVEYEWFMSRLCDMGFHPTILGNGSCHTCELGHVPHISEFLRIAGHKPCHICMSHVTYECVIYKRVISHMTESFHIWISHVTHRNKFQRIVGRKPMSHMSLVTHLNETCPTCKRITKDRRPEAHIHESKSHMNAPHINEPCHIWMRHVTHMN